MDAKGQHVSSLPINLGERSADRSNADPSPSISDPRRGPCQSCTVPRTPFFPLAPQLHRSPPPPGSEFAQPTVDDDAVVNEGLDTSGAAIPRTTNPPTVPPSHKYSETN